MIQDPLTTDEHDEFFANVRIEYDRLYRSALSCGALSEGDLSGGSHLLAKCVLQIAAASFSPTHRDGKDFLRHLEKFI